VLAILAHQNSTRTLDTRFGSSIKRNFNLTAI
jgi:hypothetical protein